MRRQVYMLRFLWLFSLLICAIVQGVEETPSAPPWPLWDGQETVAQYAERVNLPPTKELDLGNGIKLELMLIPAGEFLMGIPEPKHVDEDRFYDQMVLGALLLAVSSGVMVGLLGAVIVKAIRNRHRLQFSLARFFIMALAIGTGILSGMHWYHSTQDLNAALAEHQTELFRFEAAANSEKPAHTVRLTTPFYLGKYEVTQEQFQQVTGENPSQFKGRDLPVERVSWDAAHEFCMKLSQALNKSVGLPTEAEWEYACRAGTKTVFYTGDAESDLSRAGWYHKNSKNTTHSVGGKTPNPWGMFDMHGNVKEWCQDGLADYATGLWINPQVPSIPSYYELRGPHPLRGGAWNNLPEDCRSAFRGRDLPNSYWYDYGFRVVLVSAPRIF